MSNKKYQVALRFSFCTYSFCDNNIYILQKIILSFFILFSFMMYPLQGQQTLCVAVL